MNWLTVEDINGAIYNNQGFSWYEIDTSLISADSDFTDVKYDFCKVSRETVGDRLYEYTFEIDNFLFAKGYYAVSSVNDTFPVDTGVSYENNKLIIQTELPVVASDVFRAIKLYLLCGHIKFDSLTDLPFSLTDNKISLNLKQLNSPQTIDYFVKLTGNRYSVESILEQGYNLIRTDDTDYPIGYLLVNLVKTDFQFNCNQSLVIGAVNTVRLGASTDYKPDGDLIGEYEPEISVIWNNKNIPVTWNWELNDYTFDLDLTELRDLVKIKFKVLIQTNEVINASETEIKLDTYYKTVSDFEGLKTACGDNGTDIIAINAENIIFSDDILIAHDIKIVGNENRLLLNGYSISLKDGVTARINDLDFEGGDPAVIQKENTTVELNGCGFYYNTSSDYNQLGSCIYCDVDAQNLDVTTDFITRLNDCEFHNNQSNILHGGQLTIDNCKFNNTEFYIEDTPLFNKQNVAFLYQTDGEAIIQNSVFNIESNDDIFCGNLINIGLAQAVLMCGDNALINGVTHSDLQNNNILPFFNAPYNNRSHIFLKYYYPQISYCVYSSPLPSYENKACCHAVSGLDWVFKNNVQVTRADTGAENNLNPNL